MRVGAVIVAVLLGLLGVRSAVRLSSARFEAETLRDHLLYSIHVAARASVWFALAGAFVGFAILDEPERFRWYILIPMGLAALQVLAAIGLWRSPTGTGSQSTRGDSGRLLANQALNALREAGLDDAEIRRLADDYIALDLGEDPEDFTEWARRRSGGSVSR